MKNLITCLFVFGILNVQAATCSSLGNGAWENPATWSCGSVPGAGDTITINTGHNVTISSTNVYIGAAMFLYVDGTFSFDAAGAKLHLPCGSGVIISGTGLIQSSGPGVPSHNIKICDLLVWEGTDGPLTGPVVIGHDPLPIELVFFNGEASNYQIEFTWRTASELNNDYFSIEGSIDGQSWEVIDNVMGAGSSSEIIDYGYSFNNRYSNYEFFRLSQTDFDGTKTYSYIITVKPNSTLEFNVYPNPMNASSSSVSVNVPFESEYSISVISANGAIVYSVDGVDSERFSIHNLDLKSGVYYMNVSNEMDSKTKKLIKL